MGTSGPSGVQQSNLQEAVDLSGMSPVALFLTRKKVEAIASIATQGVKHAKGITGWDVDEARHINEEHVNPMRHASRTAATKVLVAPAVF